MSELAKNLSVLGLVLNMLGVALVWYFGLPQPSHEEGVGLGVEKRTQLSDGRTVDEHDRDVRARRFWYRWQSRIGMAMMLAGFALQLAAVWI